MKTIETKHTIRFQDCDPYGHLNNSRFLDYFINAREDQLIEHYDFNIYKYSKETGNAWVVGGHQISYFSPALLMEKVIISSQLVEWNKSDILLEMTMWNENKTQLKSIIWTRFVHINLKDMKRTDHDEQLTQKLSVDVNVTLNKMKFEERLIDLKKQR